MAKEDNSKLCAILSYLLVGIIWFFADSTLKKNSFAKYHAKQALNLLIIGIVFSVVWSVFATIIVTATFGLGAILLMPLSALIYLFWIIIWIFGIIHAAQGVEKPVPLLGQFAEKYLTF